MSIFVDKIVSNIPKPEDVFVIPSLALRTITAKNGRGVYASSDTLYKGAIFGRDSLEVAEDFIHTRPKLVRNILLTLARLQGTEYNEKNEEEPGKIVHEYRTTTVDGKPIKGTSLKIFRDLSARWGGTPTEMRYYGSVDATPQFLRTLEMYTDVYGDEILGEQVKRSDGKKISVLQAAEEAAHWVKTKLDKSLSGLLEYKRVSPEGIQNQVWKDSTEFYVHEDQQPANHDMPIASIEVQGLAYDSLVAAASFFPDRTTEYVEMAHRLRNRTIELLWREDRGYFALGIDYDEAGKLRVIGTSTANPAALLDTTFFDYLDPALREKYISAIVTAIMGRDFLTEAGIRSRALSASNLIHFWDYHGSYVTWPKETYDVAKGLRRQGFPALASQLENRLVNVVLKNRGYPEFIFVDQWGRVLASRPNTHSHGDVILVDSAHKPERVQAWTVSAIMAIISTRLERTLLNIKPDPREPWQAALEKGIYDHMPRVKTHINPFILRTKYPTYRYQLMRKRKI